MSALQHAPDHHGTGREADRRGQETADRGRVLRLVPRVPARLGRVPFIVLVASILAAGMVGLLLLNTTLQNQAFEANRLKRRTVELSYVESELQQQVIDTSSTRELTRRATALGLRPNGGVAYLDLGTGKVLGVPAVQDGRYLPSALSLTPEEVRADLEREAATSADHRREDELTAAREAGERITAARAKAEAEARARAEADARARGAQAPGTPTQNGPTQSTQTQGTQAANTQTQGNRAPAQTAQNQSANQNGAR